MRDDGAQAGLRVTLFAHRLAVREPTGIGRYFRELVCALERVAGPGQLSVASTREQKHVSWIPPGVTRHVVPWPRRPLQLAWCLGTGPRLERSLGRPDVAHLLQPFPPVRTAAPQVATVHDLFPLEHPEWYSRFDRWTYERSIRLLVRRAARIVVPSAYVADRVTEALGVERSRLVVVPLGVSGVFAGGVGAHEVAEVCRRFGLDPGGYAVCVGTVSTRKNVITTVRAAAELPAPALPLVMIGPDGHGVERVDAEILRLDGRVRILRTGFLADADTAMLVQGAAVLLHPALGEGFGFVPLEAMAVGTPVIAARLSSVPEIVGEAAVLVDEPTSPAAWAAATATLIQDDARRAALVEAGQARVRRFTWDQTARQMIDVYTDAAGD
jgi:glycosyltransferase involved in cell wall biosynthesis